MESIRFVATTVLALALSACGGSPAESQAEVADAHFQDIANAMNTRNEASAPLASKITAVFNGEITQSEFIAAYPALYNESQEGQEPMELACATPPDLESSNDSVDYELASAMLKLADEICKSENYKNLYVLAAITAGSTLYGEDFDEMIRLDEEYTIYIFNAFDVFFANDVVTEYMPEENLKIIRQLRNTYAG
jgi:hypothetical protein